MKSWFNTNFRPVETTACGTARPARLTRAIWFLAAHLACAWGQIPKMFLGHAPVANQAGERAAVASAINPGVFDENAVRAFEIAQSASREYSFVVNPQPGLEWKIIAQSATIWSDRKTITWSGQTDSPLPGLFSVAITGTNISGHVSQNGKMFNFSGQTHNVRIEEAPTPWRLNCQPPNQSTAAAHDIQHPAAQPAVPEALFQTAGNSGPPVTITVFVGYSPAARAAAGGSDAMLNQIREGISYTNQALANNGLAMRFELTGVAEIPYTETSSCTTTLYHATYPTDGLIDSLHTLRDQTASDLISFWVSNGDCGGIAWLGNSDNPYYGVSVVVTAWGSAWRNLSFAHELGHNLGSHHDRLNSGGGTGRFPYSYGYQNVSGTPYFRDIMAYECSGASCPYVQAFYSPDYYVYGRPAGRPAGTSDAADARLTFANSAAGISNYRRNMARIGTYTNGSWSLDTNGTYSADSGDRNVFFSLSQAGEIPLQGDWNGDGKADPAVYSNGTWMIDLNGNKLWDGPAVDRLIYFGGPGYQPFVGDWNGDGKANIAVHLNGSWLIDLNGNFAWDGPSIDRSIYFGGPGYTPYVGRWSSAPNQSIAVHNNGTWLIDFNGNFAWDGPSTDRSIYFGGPGYTPVLGDWNGDGITDLAAFLNGTWLVDFNGNLAWNGTSTDRLTYFGGPGYTPTSGDWNGDGRDNIGAFAAGTWVLDRNGNYLWDGSVTDVETAFGNSASRPVPARW